MDNSNIVQEALALGLDKRTANAVGAAQAISNMLKDIPIPTLAEKKAKFVQCVELEFQNNKGKAKGWQNIDWFTNNRQVDFKRNKDGTISVLAGNVTWFPPEEPPVFQHKKGQIIKIFPTLVDVWEYAYNKYLVEKAEEAKCKC
jgi:hypothetical protein